MYTSCLSLNLKPWQDPKIRLCLAEVWVREIGSLSFLNVVTLNKPPFPLFIDNCVMN